MSLAPTTLPSLADIPLPNPSGLTDPEFHAEVHRFMDLVEEVIERGGEVELAENGFPLQHIFTPGLYARQIYMPAGSVLTSQIHNTEHPFVISSGSAMVYTEHEGATLLKAPYTGVTRPGTRRVLVVYEDCIWTTFHPRSDEEKTPEDILDRITDRRERWEPPNTETKK